MIGHLLSGFGLFLCYKLDIMGICKNTYQNFKRLENISIIYKLLYSIILFTVSLKNNMYKLRESIISKFSSSSRVEKLGSHKFRISYTIDDKIYKMIVSKKRGPSDILQVLDQDSNDISDIIIPYAGSGETFIHNMELRPSTLSMKEITFNLSNGEQIKFSEDDVIRF